jgi:hypothetical protein
MRRGEVFWGVLLVILGGLFLFETAGYIRGDVLGWFWPVAIIPAGAWILMGGFRSRGERPSAHSFVVPLEGAREASLTINHGVGRMELRAGTSNDEFMTGGAAAGMNHSAQLRGDRLEVSIDAGPSFLPFIGPESGVWQYRLKPGVPTTISVHAGASQLELDLAELQVTRFNFDGGASSLDLTLPARVAQVFVEIRTGASSLHLRVPQGVAARLLAKSMASLVIDQARFAARGNGIYQSTDYDSAPHRADIVIDGGATSIQVD